MSNELYLNLPEHVFGVEVQITARMQDNDVMGYAFLRALEMMDTNLQEDRGWDAPPLLAYIERVLVDPDDLKDLPEPGPDRVREAMMLGVKVLNTDFTEMDGEGITLAMHYVAGQLRKASRKIPDQERPVGWVFSHEGWMSPPGLTPERLREIEQSGQKISDMPDRVEVRITTAIDSAGMAYQLLHQRDGDARVLVREDPTMPDPDAPWHVGGRIVDALRAICEATV